MPDREALVSSLGRVASCSGEVVVVKSEDECNRACAELCCGLGELGDGEFITLYFDSESVTYMDDHRNDEHRCALVQLCRDEHKAFLFHVALWEKCYKTFASILTDDRIR